MESQKLSKICQMGTCLAHDFVGGRLGFTCPWFDTECNLKLTQIFYLLISLSLMKDWEKAMKKYRFLALKWQMSRMRKFFPYRSNCHTFFYIVLHPETHIFTCWNFVFVIIWKQRASTQWFVFQGFVSLLRSTKPYIILNFIWSACFRAKIVALFSRK